MRGFVAAACLDAAECPEQLLGGNRAHGALTDVWIEKALQPRAEHGHRLGREGLALKRQPFRGHRLEGIRRRLTQRLAPGVGVDAIRDQLASLLALLARALQRHVGIRSQGEEFLAPVQPITQPP